MGEKSTCSGLGEIKRRIAQKRADYKRYNFNEDQNDLLKTFFDLAQEYDTLEDFYQICVSLVCQFMGVTARLYLVNDETNALELVCDSENGLLLEPEPAPVDVYCSQEVYTRRGSFMVPVLSRPVPSVEMSGVKDTNMLLGILEVSSSASFSESDRFFLGKLANRIGYNLHNRLVSSQNIRHLQFIKNLVMDIEHNVIIPNMYFKHLFNRIRKRIKDVEDLESTMLCMKQNLGKDDDTDCQDVINRISSLHQDLIDYHQEMQKHHSNCSLFLESLFRRDHFEKGHLVLHSRRCLVEKEVIIPQLEQYERRLRNQHISIERPQDMSSVEIPLNVDIGLLSQVYANFFSNAVKYTQEIHDEYGNPRKAVAYGRQFLPDYFGPGKAGIKFNVFTTGPHLDEEDARDIFNEGFRGKNSDHHSGTGHGLSFVKQVIEIHGGEVGYEPTQQGNNFVFILPLHDIHPKV